MSFVDEIKKTSDLVIESNKKLEKAKIEAEIKKKKDTINDMKNGLFAEARILNKIKEEAALGKKSANIDIYNVQDSKEAFWDKEIISFVKETLIINGFDKNQINIKYKEVKWSDDTHPFDTCIVEVTW